MFRKLIASVTFVLFSILVYAQHPFTGVYEGMHKGETIKIYIDEISGSSLNGRLMDASGVYKIEGSVIGNEIQSASIHRASRDQKMRGRFLSDRLSITFETFDEINFDQKQNTVDFKKIEQSNEELRKDSVISFSQWKDTTLVESKPRILHEHDSLLLGSWESVKIHSKAKPPMSATEVIVIHAFFPDGSCGTANSKPYRPGTKDTLHIDKPVPARDSLTAWYTENGMLYFVEKASPEKVMYLVKYKFKEGALYFINENASVISLKRREP